MTAPLVSFSGLASGFDYRSLVDAIIAQERVPATRLENQIADADAQRQAVAAYRTRIAALQTAATALRDGTAFDATTSTTTVNQGTKPLANVITAPEASPGSYTLTVQQLARTEKLAAAAVASSSDPLGITGTATINGVELNIEAGASLVDIRDAINALDTGDTPSGVRASILNVSATEQRLVLTSGQSGAEGIALADTTGTALQQLGFLDSEGGAAAGSVLIDGADAIFTLDGIALTRSSNVVSDVLEGVTMTLVSQEVGAEMNIVVDRFADSARAAMTTFVEAYNGLVEFIQSQDVATDSSRPALYNDSLIRGLRRDLPSQLLSSVLGAAPDLATASSVGLSLDRSGKLSLDASTFNDAFNTRHDDVRALFSESRTATSADVTFVSSADTVTSGSWDVEITALATQASVTTAGFSGVYDAGATPDEMVITDTRTGFSTSIVITTGMTTQQIVEAMQIAFPADGLQLEATVEGNEIRITHQDSGSASGISLSFTGLGDGTSEAWGSDTGATGTDVQGTIGGFAATGSGNMLVGAAGTAVAGLSLRYEGATTGAAGSITLGLGTGAVVERLLDRYVDTGGSLDLRESALLNRTETFNSRILDIDSRLERRRANLLSQFVRMEAAIARLQQSSASFLNALAPKSGNN